MLSEWFGASALTVAAWVVAHVVLGETAPWVSAIEVTLALALVAAVATEQVRTDRADAAGFALRVSTATVIGGAAVGVWARHDGSFVLSTAVLAPALLWIAARSASADPPRPDSPRVRAWSARAFVVVCVVFASLLATQGARAWRDRHAHFATLPPLPVGGYARETPTALRDDDGRWHRLINRESGGAVFATRICGVTVLGSGDEWRSSRSLSVRRGALPPRAYHDGWEVSRDGSTVVAVRGDTVTLYADGRAARFVPRGERHAFTTTWRVVLDDPRHAPWVLAPAALFLALAARAALSARRLRRDLTALDGWSEGSLSRGVIHPSGGGAVLVAPPSLATYVGAVTYRARTIPSRGAPFRESAAPTAAEAIPASKSWMVRTALSVIDALRAWSLIVAAAALAVALPVVLTAD